MPSAAMPAVTTVGILRHFKNTLFGVEDPLGEVVGLRLSGARGIEHLGGGRVWQATAGEEAVGGKEEGGFNEGRDDALLGR